MLRKKKSSRTQRVTDALIEQMFGKVTDIGTHLTFRYTLADVRAKDRALIEKYVQHVLGDAPAVDLVLSSFTTAYDMTGEQAERAFARLVYAATQRDRKKPSSGVWNHYVDGGDRLEQRTAQCPFQTFMSQGGILRLV